MTDLTVEEFVRVVQRSRLIDRDRLRKALAECKARGALAEGTLGVAEYLRSKGLITDWQQQNLLQGRSRGFFLGNYRLEGHLGTGGMSSVFLARHGLIDRLVAIKVLPSSKESDSRFVERFEREAIATSILSHPNIVRVFDIDTDKKTHFIVMEYVAGNNLKDIVEKEGPLALERVADYIAQTASGLQHAHQRGLVHRDIKPANLVLSDSGMIKILDLGLARLDDSDVGELTSGGNKGMMGTADYLAPEQARNAHAVDHRADIYALGCTFYYLLTGHPPFSDGSVAERILKHQSEKPMDVRAERSDCPHALADLCMTMLEKKPEDRCESCAMVAQRLVRWSMAKGYPIAPTTSEFVGGFVTVPLLPPEPADQSVAEDLLVENPDSVLENRQSRGSKTRAPLWLWIFLGIAVIVCLVLLAVVLMQQN